MAEYRVDDLDQRGSEELLKSFFADAAVGLSITDLSGRFVKVNPTYCALTGYTEAELKARDFQSITHPDDLARTLAKFQSLLSGDTSSFLIEKRYIRKDAIIVWVRNSVSLMRDEQGRPSYVVRLSQDITEQLQLEESLRQAEVRTESILAHITDVYLLFDHSWRYLYANDAAVRAIGRPREQILGRTLWELFPDIVGTDLESECRRAMDERVTVNCDFYYPARDNWWENRLYPVPAGLAVFATDITERRRADVLLRQSRNQLVEAQHIAHIGSWHWDIQTNTRSWSEELYRIFGLNPDTPALSLDAALVELVHPDDRDLFRSAVETSIASGEPCSVFYRIIRPDGAERIIHSRGNVVTDDEGVAIRMFGTAHDITERRRAEDALREAERKYRDIFENAGEGIFQTTPEGRYIAANPALARMHGFATPEEFLDGRRDIAREVYVDSARREEFKRLIDEHELVRGFEHEIYRKDGSKIWVSVNARAVRDERAKIKYYEGTAQDITERKRAETALHESETKYRDLVETAHDLIWAVDAQGTITFMNQASRRIYGYEPDELIGRSYLDLLSPEERTRQLGKLPELLASGEKLVLGSEVEAVDRDGNRRTLMANAVVLFDQQGNAIGTMGTSADITDRKQAESRILESEERYRSLFVNMLNGFAYCKVLFEHEQAQDFIYLEVNDAFEKLTGLKDVVGKKVTEIIPGIREADPEFFETCRRVALTGKPETFEIYLASLGTWHSVSLYSPRKGYFVSVFDVITERKEAEAALRESEERYRDLVENSSELICTHDLEGLVLSANPAAAAAIGYDPDEFVGKKSVRDILAPEVGHQFDEYMARLCKDGATSGIMLVQTKSGETRMWEYYNSLRTEGMTAPIVRGMARDVTEERRARKALHESEERFSKAFYSSPAPLIITRLIDGCFLNVNDSFLRTFGYARDEVIGKTVADLNIYIGQQDRGQLLDELREQGALGGYESRARTKSGRILDLLVFVEPVKLKGEQCILSTAYDITERKGMEEALRESEERYRELFENAKDALYVHDLGGRYRSFNRAAEQLSGFSRDEIIGKHFSNFVAPASLRSVRENLCKKLDDEGETTYEIDLITKDRRRVPVEVSSRLIYENGEPVGVQGVARDISERKRADEARARLALIVESSDDAIIGKTLEGTILSWNSGAERIYGYAEREVIGCHISILVPPDRIDEMPRHLEMIRRGQSISHYETLGRTKDGQLIDVSLTISPIRDARNQIVGVSTIARDITKSKQAEQALQTFSRRLIDAQEAERRHIARELHDEIGQVLTAVRLNLESLQGSTPTGIKPPQLDESLGIVDEALDRVRELSLNLRPPVLDNLGLSSALRWYVDRYARSSGLVAELRNDLEDGQRLHLDLETACFRIVQEALTNVARHAHATHVLVHLTRSNGTLNLRIRDDGVGFDAETLLKTSPPAWVLGLRGMVERADAVLGKLKIRSAAMRGTEISVSFPLKEE